MTEIAIVGGAGIYADTMALADRLVITRVHLRPAGDTTFPAIDPGVWKETERTEHQAGPGDEASFTVLAYERTDDSTGRVMVAANRNSSPCAAATHACDLRCNAVTPPL